MTARIQRKRTKGWRMPPNTAYVSRPSLFSNAYRVSDFGAELAVALFRESAQGCWYPRQTDQCTDAQKHAAYVAHSTLMHRFERMTLAEAARVYLRGKNLACWCALEDEQGSRVPCHADVLLELARQVTP